MINKFTKKQKQILRTIELQQIYHENKSDKLFYFLFDFAPIVLVVLMILGSIAFNIYVGFYISIPLFLVYIVQKFSTQLTYCGILKFSYIIIKDKKNFIKLCRVYNYLEIKMNN